MVALPEASTGLPAEELVAALRAQLAELGVEVVVSSRPFEATGEISPDKEKQEDSALAFVWLGREGENLSVHFFESAGATLRQRRLPLRGTDAASLEEVAIVVRSAVGALLERGEPEQRDEEPPAPAPEPDRLDESDRVSEPERSQDDEPRLFWASLGWTGQSFAQELSFSHGAAVLLGVRPTKSHWGVGFGYTFLPAQTAARDGVSVELSRHPVEIAFRVDSSSKRASYFGAEAGMLVDWIKRSSDTTSVEFAVTPEVTRVSWAVTGRALVGLRLSGPFSLEIQGGADWVMNRVSTELESGEGLVQPHRVRPRVLAQILWNFP